MRPWLLAFTFAILLGCISFAQQAFPGNAPVTFTFRETLKDKVVPDPDTLPEDQAYIIGTERTLTIQGTAPLTDFDLSELDEFSPYGITIGDFDSSQISGLQGRFSDDEDYDSTSTNTELSQWVHVPIMELTYDGDEVEVGYIDLRWNSDRVKFVVQMDNVNQVLTAIEYTVATDFYRERDEAIDAEDLLAGFNFGPFSFNFRTVYTVGTASFWSDDRVSELLSDVTLEGAIDYVPPTVAITQILGNGEPIAGTTTASETVTIVGTAADTREIKKLKSTPVFPGEVDSVEVMVGTNQAPGTFATADLNGSSWVFPNVQLTPGDNFIVARVTDVHGNVTTTPRRKITFLTKGTINVTAQASGFPAGPSVLAGTVSAGFLTNASKKITALTDGALATTSVKNVVAGQQYTITATPAPGAVFNGWSATLDGAAYFTSVDEKLTFETKPNLVLKADFVPNPFDPIFGTYHGLVTGDSAAERGTFKIAIGKTGAFTGKIKAGIVSLPLRGKVLGSGRWEGIVKARAGEYSVAFQLNVSGAGNRDLAGTLTGGGLTADISADLNSWRKPRKNDLGNLATEYAATYNVVLLPPAPADPLPAGGGYGRVTISPLGAVKFIGRLGDGTSVSVGATLVKKVTGSVFFPFFCPLDKGKGNLSGKVTYDAQPETDLNANLDWSEPATTKVEPQAFSGQIALTGSRYSVPAAGGFVILGGVNGSGKVQLILPAYTVPETPPAVPSNVSGNATLDPETNLVTAAPAITQAFSFKMKVTPKTGIFTGSITDPQLDKTLPFAGALVQKANGGLGLGAGVFTRGNKTGAIIFGPQ